MADETGEIACPGVIDAAFIVDVLGQAQRHFVRCRGDGQATAVRIDDEEMHGVRSHVDDP